MRYIARWVNDHEWILGLIFVGLGVYHLCKWAGWL